MNFLTGLNKNQIAKNCINTRTVNIYTLNFRLNIT